MGLQEGILMNFSFHWDEVNSLITILNAKGISYLMGVVHL